MSKAFNFLLFLVPAIFLTSCGDSDTLRLAYTAAIGAAQPDFIAIIEVDPNLSEYKQNLGPTEEGIFFYSSDSNLRKCAVDEGQINMVEHPNFLSSAEQAAVDPVNKANCTALGQFYSTEIFKGTSLNLGDDPDSGLNIADGFNFGDVSDGFVFVLFFFNQEDSGASIRCFQIFAAEIRDKKIIDLTGASLDLVAVQLTSETDGNRCFSYK